MVGELLQIPFSSEHINLAEQLIRDPHRKIISFYDQWFVFFAFQDLLLGTISQEDFIALWDSFGQCYSYQNNPILAKEALFYWLLHEPEVYTESFILFPKEEKLSVENAISSLYPILKKIKSQIVYL